MLFIYYNLELLSLDLVHYFFWVVCQTFLNLECSCRPWCAWLTTHLHFVTKADWLFYYYIIEHSLMLGVSTALTLWILLVGAVVHQLLEQSSMSPRVNSSTPISSWLYMSRCPWTTYWSPVVCYCDYSYSCFDTLSTSPLHLIFINIFHLIAASLIHLSSALSVLFVSMFCSIRLGSLPVPLWWHFSKTNSWALLGLHE